MPSVYRWQQPLISLKIRYQQKRIVGVCSRSITICRKEMYREEIERIKEALTLWAYLESKDIDERKAPEEVKQRRKYHLKVFNDFNKIIQSLWNGQTDIHPEWEYYKVWNHIFDTSVSESKGGEDPKKAKVKGVNAPKKRK